MTLRKALDRGVLTEWMARAWLRKECRPEHIGGNLIKMKWVPYCNGCEVACWIIFLLSIAAAVRWEVKGIEGVPPWLVFTSRLMIFISSGVWFLVHSINRETKKHSTNLVKNALELKQLASLGSFSDTSSETQKQALVTRFQTLAYIMVTNEGIMKDPGSSFEFITEAGISRKNAKSEFNRLGDLCDRFGIDDYYSIPKYAEIFKQAEAYRSKHPQSEALPSPFVLSEPKFCPRCGDVLQPFPVPTKIA